MRSCSAIASRASSGGTLALMRSRASVMASIADEQLLGGEDAGEATHLVHGVGVDEVDVGAEAQHERVAVDGGQVDEGTVDDVAAVAGGAGLLLLLEGGHLRADVRRLGARGRVGAERLHQLRPLRGVALGGRGARLLVGDLGQIGCRPDGIADARRSWSPSR